MNLCLCITFFAATIARSATTQPTTSVTQPTAANLQLVEWAVFVVDASGNSINPQGWVTSTLPGFVTDHRFSMAPITPVTVTNPNGNMFFNGRFWTRIDAAPSDKGDSKPQLADSDQPSPVGVIRLIGSADSKVDVSIATKDGSFLGSWPKAEERDKQLLWRDLTVSSQPTDQPPLVATTHWFTQLRAVDSAYLSMSHSATDRFLLYDLEQPYTAPFKLKSAGDFKYEIENQTGCALHDLTLYQGDHDAWRSVQIGDIAASSHPATTAPVSVKTVGSKELLGITVSDVSSDPARAGNFGFRSTVGVFVDSVDEGGPSDNKLHTSDIIMSVNSKRVKSAAEFASQLTGNAVKLRVFRANRNIPITIELAHAATTGPTTTSATTLPATQPATIATTRPVNAYQLTTSATTQPADLTQAWKPIITGSGIDPGDADIMLRVLHRYAFDPHRLTAVYRMDNAELDRMLPIEVVPQPAKISRFALVIVINADQSAGTIVDDLIKQLGDEDWLRRDAAYNALAGMGPAAQGKLNAAKNNNDLEIAWRAERLLGLLPAAAK